MRIDAHCHYWDLSRGDYGWLTDALAPIYRDFGAADHDAVSIRHEVEGRVLVQAAPTVAETDYLLACAKADRKAVGVVGWVDLADPGAVAELERLAADPAFKGVRPMLQDIADPDWIMTAPHPEAIAALKRLGLRFDALCTPRQIEAVVAFARAHPDLPIIVDHAAKPILSNPGDPLNAVWEKGMAELGAMEHVDCKLSGVLNEMDPARITTPEATARALQPCFDRLLEGFGPARLAWGSDWPVLNLAADYGFWVAVSDMLIAPLSPNEREQIGSGTAARFYGLGEEAS